MWRLLVLTILALCCARTAAAEDAKQFFDSLYGNRLKQVKATIDRGDDLVLAKEILAAAQSIERTDVVGLMCDHAIDLSQRHADGLPTAIDAARLLAEKVEPRRSEARKKLVELLLRQSASSDPKVKEKAGDDLINLLTLQGDEAFKAGKYDDALAGYRQAMTAAQRQKSPAADTLKEKIELAGNRSRVEKQIARLREKLLADATDTVSVHEIIRLYVVDLDTPAEAMKVLDRAKDAKLIKLVPLAAKGAENASEPDCLALGEWYSELATSAAASSKEAMMRRASAYLTRYLGFQPTDQLARTKAEVMLKPIATSLAAIDAERAKTELRNGPETWISKDATYTISSDQGYGRRPDLLTGGNDLQDGEFAFCTRVNTPSEFVVIDLGKPMMVSRIWIENRRNRFQDRAKGITLTLSLEANQKTKPVWTAEKAEKEWTIQLDEKRKVRYLTIKADKNCYALHLAQVKVFGWDDAAESKPSEKPKAVVPLVDRPVEVVHTWGNGGIQRDVAVNETKLDYGFQTHPSSGRPAQLAFQLDGAFELLQGAIGVNDKSAGPASDLVFKIVGDGKELWQSKPTRRKGVVQAFRVDVRNVQKLELFVHCTDDGNCAAVWVEPMLYAKASSAPAITGKKFLAFPIDDKAK